MIIHVFHFNIETKKVEGSLSNQSSNCGENVTYNVTVQVNSRYSVKLYRT